MNGWIKIHKKLMEWEYYTDIKVKSLFLHCLLKANFKAKPWRGIMIKRGQFVTSIDNLSRECGLTPQETRTCLKKLKKSKNLTSTSTNKFTLVTVTNYDFYQVKDEEATSTSTNEQQTNNKRTTTTEEVKEYKEYINEENNFNDLCFSGVGFDGDVIKLSPFEFREIFERYSFGDEKKFRALLKNRDKWYSKQPYKVYDNWMVATCKWLAKKKVEHGKV